jgi:hypothetical protein
LKKLIIKNLNLLSCKEEPYSNSCFYKLKQSEEIQLHLKSPKHNKIINSLVNLYNNLESFKICIKYKNEFNGICWISSKRVSYMKDLPPTVNYDFKINLLKSL